MPLGLVCFPLLARAIGTEQTLFAAAAICAATNLAVAYVPGVRAIAEPPPGGTLGPLETA